MDLADTVNQQLLFELLQEIIYGTSKLSGTTANHFKSIMLDGVLDNSSELLSILQNMYTINCERAKNVKACGFAACIIESNNTTMTELVKSHAETKSKASVAF